MDPLRTRAKFRAVRRWAAPIVWVSLLLCWMAGWTLGFAIFLGGISAGVVWRCWHWVCHLAHHVRLRLAGHVATATVVSYREDRDADERAYLALVSFVTREGEVRPSTPLTFQYEEPPPDPERPTPLAEGYKVPAIGRTLRVVYDPRDPTWADERSGWAEIALGVTFGIVGLLLFGTLLISTIVVAPQAIEGTAIRH